MLSLPLAAYAHSFFRLSVFTANFESGEERAFAAALESFQALTRRTDNAADARGDKLSLASGYIEKMAPNAFADIHEGHHVIGMHSALLVTMMEFALFVLCQADQFPGVGMAADEVSPSYGPDDAPGLYLLKMTLAGDTVQSARDQARVPKDADRHVMAVYLAMMMARFVWFHGTPTA